VQKEFYDYSTERGQLELDNNPNDSRVNGLYENLIQNIVPNELQERLPGRLGVQQALSKRAHLIWDEFIALQQPSGLKAGDLHKLLGFGWEF
jgi:uncharacterized sulfatase